MTNVYLRRLNQASSREKEKMEIVHSLPFEFYGEIFSAYLADNRNWYLPLQEVCNALGIDTNGQRQRILRDEAINDRLVNIPMETPYRNSTRVKDVACLNLRALPYWLGTIDAARIKEEHRKKVILFKREFSEAAWYVFRSDIVPPEVLSEMDSYATPQEQEYGAIMDEARQLRKRIDLLSGKVDKELERMDAGIQDLDGRLGTLETTLVDRAIINSAQAKLLSDMIGLVALSMHERNRKKAKSLCFAEVHNDFKATFDVHIYSVLPVDQIDEAMDYLANRWQRLNPEDPLPDIFRSGHQPSLF